MKKLIYLASCGESAMRSVVGNIQNLMSTGTDLSECLGYPFLTSASGHWVVWYITTSLRRLSPTI